MSIHVVLIDLFRSLPRHQAVSFVAFNTILHTFCATRNVFYLRLMPLIVVAEIMRVVLIWVTFLLNTREATFLRDIHFLIAGRIKKETYKTRHATGKSRRRLEAHFLGAINQFHGLWFNYAESYLDKIAVDAKKRREAQTKDFLSALNQGKRETEEVVMEVKNKAFRIYRRNRKNFHAVHNGPAARSA
mmetsp:Transcript_13545/g.29419  ORF Transcript_13545/g.29419 Transcript_13545/m.29419 type:complete len:188 (-) Transcript_13545:57-620(-)